MNIKYKYDVITLFGVVGFGISLYLTVMHYVGFTVPCNVTHGCEIVLNSKYAMVLGFPLALWGALYFLGVIVSSVFANRYRFWQTVCTTLLYSGGLISLVLLGIQFFVIKKVCQYCFGVDVLNVLLLLWNLNVEYVV